MKHFRTMANTKRAGHQPAETLELSHNGIGGVSPLLRISIIVKNAIRIVLSIERMLNWKNVRSRACPRVSGIQNPQATPENLTIEYKKRLP